MSNVYAQHSAWYHKIQVIVAILLLLSTKSCQTWMNSVQFHNMHRAPGLCQEPCLALGKWGGGNPWLPGAHRRQSINKSLGYSDGTVAAEIPKECCCCSFQSLSHAQLSATHGLQHTKLPCPLLSPGICSNSCPLSQWCYLNLIFCYCFLLLPSIFPSIRVFFFFFFPVSPLFTSSGQSIEASGSESVLPVNTQGWFPLGLTGLISLQFNDYISHCFLYIPCFNILYSVSINFWSFTSFSLLSWIEGYKIEEKVNKYFFSVFNTWKTLQVAIYIHCFICKMNIISLFFSDEETEIQ